MDYSMQGSKDSYSPQVHNLYPDAQPGLYPPPPPPTNPQGGYGYQYQGYFSEAANNPPYYTGSWPEQSAAPSGGDGGQGRRHVDSPWCPCTMGNFSASFAPDGGPFHYQFHQYQDDADCITFLRGCLAGLCRCCLLERCCLCY